MREFDAMVIRCEQIQREEAPSCDHRASHGEDTALRYRVLLDQTAFFPEAGGQLADTGEMHILEVPGESGTEQRQVHVWDVQEAEGLLWHETDGILMPGTRVRGILNWPERFAKMQHHGGEHIVSGLVSRRFGYRNVGFHLGRREVTLDFDHMLTAEQLRQIEYEANEAVTADLPIRVTYPTKEELSHLQYRSKIEIPGQVRLVEIPGCDLCACCAPHMKTTGQIGMIRLIDMHPHRGGVRVYMLCGFAALEDYRIKHDSVKMISAALSTPTDQIAAAVERLREEQYHLRGEILRLTDSLLEAKVAAVAPGAETVLLVESGLDNNQPRELVNKLMDRGVRLAAVFAAQSADSYRYVLGSRSEDVRELTRIMNQTLNGRGGGKPEMTQGSVVCSEEQIRSFFEKTARKHS